MRGSLIVIAVLGLAACGPAHVHQQSTTASGPVTHQDPSCAIFWVGAPSFTQLECGTQAQANASLRVTGPNAPCHIVQGSRPPSVGCP